MRCVCLYPSLLYLGFSIEFTFTLPDKTNLRMIMLHNTFQATLALPNL